MKALLTDQKLKGAYYTPKPIADFLAKWAVRSKRDSVLEPSCGDGEILQSAVEILRHLGANKNTISNQVFGVELNKKEAQRAVERLRKITGKDFDDSIHVGDFFSYCDSKLHEKDKFDVVIGNPPFIRYQNFEEKQKETAFSLMRRYGLHPNGLTNAWVPFICASSALLNSNGRLAMVVPAELLQVGYTGELRMFLSEHFEKITLITFKKLVFKEVLQEVVLLCGEMKANGNKGIRIIEISDIEDLNKIDFDLNDSEPVKPMDHSTEKWTQYFLTKQEINLIRKLRTDKSIKKLGELCSVDVGIVTGNNDFFILSHDEKIKRNLNGTTRKIVTRSGHLKGIRFDENDWSANAENGFPVHILALPEESISKFSKDVRAYIRHGENLGLNNSYKCRIRRMWHSVPSVWTPDAFLLRQIHEYPKLILNTSKATCTDTIHRVRFAKGVNPKKVAVSFLNSLTFAFSEIIGRSYGGGVLELEPREAENIPVPYEQRTSSNANRLDSLIRSGNVQKVLAINDEELLEKGLKLKRSEIFLLRSIWNKLKNRRLHRN